MKLEPRSLSDMGLCPPGDYKPTAIYPQNGDSCPETHRFHATDNPPPEADEPLPVPPFCGDQQDR